MTKRLLVTPGEPAGIGPDITVQVAQQSWDADLTVIADPDMLRARAKQLKLPLDIIECDADSHVVMHQPGTLRVIPVKLNQAATPGKLNPANASYVMKTLEMAAESCTKNNSTVVTGPVHKGILNQAGIAFTGHTEFFAQMSATRHTVMLFVIDKLKVALLTTHLPLASVPAAVTAERLRLTLSILHAGLEQDFHIANPAILICGLNPHAGENGYLGREEIDVITPVLEELRQQKHWKLEGPLPADTAFTPGHLQHADAILAMYHDQALPVVKHIGFDRAVNVTLGLPFIRTSVDHGTALDIAGTGKADAGSMKAAITLAIQLSRQNRHG